MTPVQEQTVKISDWRVRFIAAWCAFWAKDAFVMVLDNKDHMGYSIRYSTEKSLEIMRKHLNQATSRLNHIVKKGA